MVTKLYIPVNNLGPFLTAKKISNIDIHAKTGIPTVELSQLRSGDIETIRANKLFLIAKVGKIDIKDMLLGVYPELRLNSAEDIKFDFQSISDFFNYVQKDVIQMIADKTGLAVYRIKKIKANKVNPAAHELYLIELATKTKPGTLFNILFKDLQLNSSEEEANLRLLEKKKSRKTS
ncbi:hypothetical protein SAMN05421820_101463 [Pedobacter steynii]|uniref:Uncharacterized protein n=1 Tax=Pedobacter steynii TaxID=430522 RepID=A0A1G9K403_9SPHI|nr:hypothetical protein [Pedobacter steynii]NQX38442.1 hypothetical protein [Pedobacter steynii]SDL44527.1 hypothetical protein SAMN05421820_101463 [Pedobacter steynii]